MSPGTPFTTTTTAPSRVSDLADRTDEILVAGFDDDVRLHHDVADPVAALVGGAEEHLLSLDHEPDDDVVGLAAIVWKRESLGSHLAVPLRVL